MIGGTDIESSVLIFPEDAFSCTEDQAEYFINEVKRIAKENNINILFPLLRMPDVGVQDNGDVMAYGVQLEIQAAQSGKKNQLVQECVCWLSVY